VTSERVLSFPLFTQGSSSSTLDGSKHIIGNTQKKKGVALDCFNRVFAFSSVFSFSF